MLHWSQEASTGWTRNSWGGSMAKRGRAFRVRSRSREAERPAARSAPWPARPIYHRGLRLATCTAHPGVAADARSRGPAAAGSNACPTADVPTAPRGRSRVDRRVRRSYARRGARASGRPRRPRRAADRDRERVHLPGPRAGPRCRERRRSDRGPPVAPAGAAGGPGDRRPERDPAPAAVHAGRPTASRRLVARPRGGPGDRRWHDDPPIPSRRRAVDRAVRSAWRPRC